jgi:glycosyltransferase involved in cell wall biosynthesis
VRLQIVTQDPRFGGGVKAMTEAFWQALVELGHEPSLVYLSRMRGLSPRMVGPRLALRAEQGPSPLHGIAVPSVLPELDAVNQVIAGERSARSLRSAPFLWVVSATAPYGWAAYRSGRPYGLWLATDLSSEFSARRPRLPRSRRTALALNEPALERLERLVVRNARVVTTISNPSRIHLAERAGLRPDALAILPIPIDPEVFSPLADDAWEAGLAEPTVVFAGRADDPRKNVELLLAAYPAMRARIPSVRLRLVGEPPTLDGLDPEIEVVGRVDSIADALRSASLLVLPSLQEGFGIVVAEAMACGIPVVVTPCGGPEQLVAASQAGIVLDGWDPAELADAVVSLLEDPPHLWSMRRAGPVYIAREHTFVRFVALVDDALAQLARDPEARSR